MLRELKPPMYVGCVVAACAITMSVSGCGRHASAPRGTAGQVNSAAMRISADGPFDDGAQGYAHLRAQRLDEALACFVKAAAIADKAKQDKEWAPIYTLEAARLFEQKGRGAEAQRWYEMALARLSAYRDKWTLRGMDRRNGTGDFGEVLERCAWEGLKRVRPKLAKDRPTGQWVQRQLPFLQFPDSVSDKGAEAKAATKQDRALRSGAGNAVAHSLLGTHLLGAGEPEKATVELLAATVLDPNEPIAWDNLGWAYLMQGRMPEAAAALRVGGKLGDGSSTELANRIDGEWEQFCRNKK